MEDLNLMAYTIVVLTVVLSTLIQVFYLKPMMVSEKEFYTEVSQQFLDSATIMITVMTAFLSCLSFAFIPCGTVLSGSLLLLVMLSGICLIINIIFFGFALNCS
jgi:hypothetical protein